MIFFHCSLSEHENVAIKFEIVIMSRLEIVMRLEVISDQ